MLVIRLMQKVSFTAIHLIYSTFGLMPQNLYCDKAKTMLRRALSSAAFLQHFILVVIVLINRDVMHAGDEMSRNRSIHGMHHSYFYATNCGANCLEASCVWDKSGSLFAQLPY